MYPKTLTHSNARHPQGELVGEAAKEYRAERKYEKEMERENGLINYLNPTGKVLDNTRTLHPLCYHHPR